MAFGCNSVAQFDGDERVQCGHQVEARRSKGTMSKRVLDSCAGSCKVCRIVGTAKMYDAYYESANYSLNIIFSDATVINWST